MLGTILVFIIVICEYLFVGVIVTFILSEILNLIDVKDKLILYCAGFPFVILYLLIIK